MKKETKRMLGLVGIITTVVTFGGLMWIPVVIVCSEFIYLITTTNDGV